MTAATLQPGELFVALRGPQRDGHDFIPDALARGAGAALVDRDAGYPLPVIKVDERQETGRPAGRTLARRFRHADHRRDRQ